MTFGRAERSVAEDICRNANMVRILDRDAGRGAVAEEVDVDRMAEGLVSAMPDAP